MCWSLWRIVTLEQRRIILVHLDELDQAFNAEVGERQDAVIADAIDPDAVLDLHFVGDVVSTDPKASPKATCSVGNLSLSKAAYHGFTRCDPGLSDQAYPDAGDDELAPRNHRGVTCSRDDQDQC